MTNIELKEKLIELTKDNENITEIMIDEVIANNDFDILKDSVKLKYSFEIWDKTSSINGTPASDILKFSPYNIAGWTGETYLVKENSTNNVLYFQRYKPNVSGFVPMSLLEAQTFAIGSIEDIATITTLHLFLELLFKGE